MIRKAQCGGAGSAPADELKTHFIRKGPASEGQRCEGEGRVMARGLDRRVARTGASVTEIRKFIISATPPAGDLFLPDAMVGSRPDPEIACLLFTIEGSTRRLRAE